MMHSCFTCDKDGWSAAGEQAALGGGATFSPESKALGHSFARHRLMPAKLHVRRLFDC
jgi:hypothetical protein